MAKYILVLQSALLLVALLNISKVSADKNMPEWEECKVAEKVTDADLQTMKNHNEPKTRPIKCFFTCIGEKSGKIFNNKLVPDAALTWFKKSPMYTEQLQQSFTEILEECKNVTDPDRCEAGSKIMDCLREGAMKRGIKPPGGHHGKDQKS